MDSDPKYDFIKGKRCIFHDGQAVMKHSCGEYLCKECVRDVKECPKCQEPVSFKTKAPPKKARPAPPKKEKEPAKVEKEGGVKPEEKVPEKVEPAKEKVEPETPVKVDAEPVEQGTPPPVKKEVTVEKDTKRIDVPKPVPPPPEDEEEVQEEADDEEDKEDEPAPVMRKKKDYTRLEQKSPDRILLLRVRRSQ